MQNCMFFLMLSSSVQSPLFFEDKIHSLTFHELCFDEDAFFLNATCLSQTKCPSFHLFVSLCRHRTVLSRLANWDGIEKVIILLLECLFSVERSFVFYHYAYKCQCAYIFRVLMRSYLSILTCFRDSFFIFDSHAL